MERCGKINAVNSGSESWTGIGVVTGFDAVVLILQWPHMRMMMRTEKSNCFISYNKLGPFTKLATSYLEDAWEWATQADRESFVGNHRAELQKISSCKFIGDDLQLCGNLLGEPQLFPLLVKPTVCPFVASRNLLLYHSLPITIP